MEEALLANGGYGDPTASDGLREPLERIATSGVQLSVAALASLRSLHAAHAILVGSTTNGSYGSGEEEGIAGGDGLRLQVLELPDSGLADAHMESLAEFLLGCGRDGSSSNGDSSTLNSGSGLRRVCLAYNCIGDKGIASLCAALYAPRVSARLRVLDLRGNGAIGDDGVRRLVHVLASAKPPLPLEQLELGGNRITKDGARTLCGYFATQRSSNSSKTGGGGMYSDHLRTLVLSENPIGNEGAAAVAAMLCSGQCQRLQEIGIAGCAIGDFGFQMLCEALEACTGEGSTSSKAASKNTKKQGEASTAKQLLALEVLAIGHNRISNAKLVMRLLKALRLAAPRFGITTDSSTALRVAGTIEAAAAAATDAAPVPVASSASLVLRRRNRSRAAYLGGSASGSIAGSLCEIAADSGRLPPLLLLEKLAETLGLPPERFVLLKQRKAQALSNTAGNEDGSTKRSMLLVMVVQVRSDAAIQGVTVVAQLLSLAQASRHPLHADGDGTHSVTMDGDNLYSPSNLTTAASVSRLRELGVRWVAMAAVVDATLTPARAGKKSIMAKSRAQRRKQQLAAMNGPVEAAVPGGLSLQWRRVTVAPPLPYASGSTHRTIIAEGYGEREAEKAAAEKAKEMLEVQAELEEEEEEERQEQSMLERLGQEGRLFEVGGLGPGSFFASVGAFFGGAKRNGALPKATDADGRAGAGDKEGAAAGDDEDESVEAALRRCIADTEDLATANAYGLMEAVNAEAERIAAKEQAKVEKKRKRRLARDRQALKMKRKTFALVGVPISEEEEAKLEAEEARLQEQEKMLLGSVAEGDEEDEDEEDKDGSEEEAEDEEEAKERMRAGTEAAEAAELKLQQQEHNEHLARHQAKLVTFGQMCGAIHSRELPRIESALQDTQAVLREEEDEDEYINEDDEVDLDGDFGNQAGGVTLAVVIQAGTAMRNKLQAVELECHEALETYHHARKQIHKIRPPVQRFDLEAGGYVTDLEPVADEVIDMVYEAVRRAAELAYNSKMAKRLRYIEELSPTSTMIARKADTKDDEDEGGQGPDVDRDGGESDTRVAVKPEEWVSQQKRLKLNLVKAMVTGDPRKLRQSLVLVCNEYGSEGSEEGDGPDGAEAKEEKEQATAIVQLPSGSLVVQGMEDEILSAVATLTEWVNVLCALDMATQRSVAKNAEDEDDTDEDENNKGESKGDQPAKEGGEKKQLMQHNSRDVGELRQLLLRAASVGVHVELVAVHDAREQLATAEMELTAAEAPLQLQIARLLRRSKEAAKGQATKLAKSVLKRQLALVGALHERMNVWLKAQADGEAGQAEEAEQEAVIARAERLAYQRIQSGRQSLGTHWRVARRRLERADAVKAKARAAKKQTACVQEETEALAAAMGLAALTAAGAAAFAGEMAAVTQLHACQAKSTAAAATTKARVQSEEQVRRTLEVAATKAGREAEEDAAAYSKQTTKWQRKMVHGLVVALSDGEVADGETESRAEDDMEKVAKATANAKTKAENTITNYVRKEDRRAAELRRVMVAQVAQWMADQTAKAKAIMKGKKEGAKQKCAAQNLQVQRAADLNVHKSVVAAVDEKVAKEEGEKCVEEEVEAHQETFKELMLVIDERFQLKKKLERQETERRLADMVEVMMEVEEEHDVQIEVEEEEEVDDLEEEARLKKEAEEQARKEAEEAEDLVANGSLEEELRALQRAVNRRNCSSSLSPSGELQQQQRYRAAERAELEAQLRKLQARAHHEPEWSAMEPSEQRLQMGALRLQASVELRQFGGGHALGQLLEMEQAELESMHEDGSDDESDGGESKQGPEQGLQSAIHLAQTITRTQKQQEAGVIEFVAQGTQSIRGKARAPDGLEAIGRYPQLRPAEEFKYEGKSKWKKLKKSMQVSLLITLISHFSAHRELDF
jgi:hypothetical protein